MPRETARERLRRLRSLRCGECRQPYPDHAPGCDPEQGRIVTLTDLLRRDHDTGWHTEPHQDCPQCAAEKRRPGGPGA